MNKLRISKRKKCILTTEILELKNTVTKPNDLQERLNTKLDQTEERISNNKDKSIEIIHSEDKKKIKE